MTYNVFGGMLNLTQLQLVIIYDSDSPLPVYNNNSDTRFHSVPALYTMLTTDCSEAGGCTLSITDSCLKSFTVTCISIL